MRIYLAGPMRGLPNHNFLEFHKYAAYLRAQGHEVFSPAEVNLPQNNIRAIFAVEMDWLCREAEAVYLMPGWSQSRGARAEQALAEAMDLKVRCLLPLGPDYSPPGHPLANSYQSPPEFSTTSPSHSQKLQKLVSQARSNTEPRGGTGLGLRTRQTLLYAIFLIVVFATVTGLGILLKWRGEL